MTATWQEECTASHHAIAASLLRSFGTEGEEIAQTIGGRPLAELIAAHRLWSDWLGTGRVRKFAIVAEKRHR